MAKTPRQTVQKRFYYHVSSSNWRCDSRGGVLLKPKKIYALDEPSLPRICVCPTVSGCYSAICWDCDRIYIWRTKQRVYAYHPYSVSDSRLTGERWLIRPTRFCKVGQLSRSGLQELRSLDDGDIFSPGCDIESQRQVIPLLRQWFANRGTKFIRRYHGRKLVLV